MWSKTCFWLVFPGFFLVIKNILLHGVLGLYACWKFCSLLLICNWSHSYGSSQWQFADSFGCTWAQTGSTPHISGCIISVGPAACSNFCNMVVLNYIFRFWCFCLKNKTIRREWIKKRSTDQKNHTIGSEFNTFIHLGPEFHWKYEKILSSLIYSKHGHSFFAFSKYKDFF